MTPQQEGRQQNESELEERRELNITERFDTEQLADDEDCEDSDTSEESEEGALLTIPEEQPSSEESSDSEESEDGEEDDTTLMQFVISGHREALQVFQDYNATGSEKEKEERRRLNVERRRQIKERCDALRAHIAPMTHEWRRLISILSKN